MANTGVPIIYILKYSLHLIRILKIVSWGLKYKKLSDDFAKFAYLGLDTLMEMM